MFFEILSTLGLLLFLVFVWAVWYGRRQYGMLDNCGFPVIPPTLFLGSDPYFYKDVQHFKDIQRAKEYGPIWGLYLGQSPQVFVADPEMIRLIMVKDYDHFHNRREADLGSPIINEVLDFLPGEKWRTVRSTLSPLFTTAKLKTMTATMDAHAQEYVEDLKLECDQTGRIKYNCKIRLTAWLIDMFAQTTLGIQLENRKDPDNKFALAFRKLMGEDLEYGLLYSLSMTFPFLTNLTPTCDDSQSKLIETTFRHILDTRRHSSEKKATLQKSDFVDVLNDIMSKVNTKEFNDLGITESTVISQAVNFFLGGYETSSTTISHLFYYIAQNPEIQDRLYAEIVSTFATKKVDHESIKEENTPYLTACLNESLRLAPPLRPERICTKDWTFGGYRIRKGTIINFPFSATHRNPKLFSNPDEFKPERFLAENKSEMNPYANGAFGFGPRNCIGMRFAYDSIKTFLIHFVLNVRLKTQDPLFIFTI